MENDSFPPSQNPFTSSGHVVLRNRGAVLVFILVVALIGFEMFNYSTTEYALADLLGDMRFAGVRWSTILALAFCGIDFAGIARLFTPDEPETGTKEIWFLFAAWLLAATMNAFLTWWGVAMALTNRTLLSTSIVDPNILTHGVPVFVAAIVWVTRILLISNLSASIARFFARQAAVPYENQPRPAPSRQIAPPPQSRRAPTSHPTVSRPQPAARPAAAPTQPAPAVRNGQPNPRPIQNRPQPSQKPVQPEPEPEEDLPPEPEYIPEAGYAPYRPTYHSLSARANPTNGQSGRRS